LSASRFSESRLAALDDAIQGEIAVGRIPGAVMLIADGERVLFERARGVRDPAGGDAMAMDTIFRIYSMTKPIVSVGAMMLVEEGRLLISDPVAKYLPELGRPEVGVELPGTDGQPVLMRVPAKREITVQDLLRHTSGLTYGIFGDSLVKREYRRSGVAGKDLANAELAQRLGRLPLAHQPASVWEYGHSTDLLGALIERISGLPLDRYLRQRILAPLGMDDTGFWVAPEAQRRLAEPFAVDPEGGAPVHLIDVTRPPAFLSGGGGMVSTARDYLRFARMLLNQGSLAGVRILARKTLAFMTSDHLGGIPGASAGKDYLPGPGYGFGLGFAVRTDAGRALTPGSVGDYHWSGLAGTYFWVDPRERFTAIWLMQAPEQRARYRQLYRNLVYAALE